MSKTSDPNLPYITAVNGGTFHSRSSVKSQRSCFVVKSSLSRRHRHSTEMFRAPNSAPRRWARPITTIATVTRGIAAAHVTSHWDYVYPLRLAEQTDDGIQLSLVDDVWRENVQPDLMERLTAAYGDRPSVEDVGWFVFGVLSAPAYRERFAAALAIDHPRIPFPATADAFERMRSLGEELGRAHLLEATVPPDVRFEGEGDGVVGPPRHDPGESVVWINSTQCFTGVPTDAWAWGGAFRPLGHFLTDRRGRRLDAEQIAMFQSAIWAVRESIRLAPGLDAALVEVLTTTLRSTPDAERTSASRKSQIRRHGDSKEHAS